MITDPAARRRQLYSLLGKLPPRDRSTNADLIRTDEGSGYVRETLLLDLNGTELVPAYFVKPKDATGRLPVVLFNHSHGGDYNGGKEEMVQGKSYLQDPPYAQALTQAGYAALCIDHWNFGQRRGRTESSLFKQLLWQGQVLWGVMVYDSLKAIDYLVTRDDIDAGRIGTVGLSMGSTMAWWVAALDERVRACVDICCLTDFHALIETQGLDGHGIYYYVPSLLEHFDTGDINELIVPRAHLALAGLFDPLTPPAGLDRIDERLQAAYGAAGVADRWQLLRYHTGHFETAHGRRAIFQFLERWL